jgi:RNA polymerase sigma-70 factor, ECF subfamily
VDEFVVGVDLGGTKIEAIVARRRGDPRAIEILDRRRVLTLRDEGYEAVLERYELATRPDVARDPSVLSWLFTVVRNACLRLLRPFARERKSLGARVEEEETDDVPSQALDPEAALERWRLVHAVHQAISTLDRPRRDVIIMRDLEGLSGPDACTALGLTEATMKTRLQRARAELRREIERSNASPFSLK